jgi:periplasmic protein TonB
MMHFCCRNFANFLFTALSMPCAGERLGFRQNSGLREQLCGHGVYLFRDSRELDCTTRRRPAAALSRLIEIRLPFSRRAATEISLCAKRCSGGVSVSELGSLSSCMLENDAEARSRARKLRQKALVASIVFEAALIGAMLVWPLITPGVLPARFNITPAPPYHGGGDSVERHMASSAHPPTHATNRPPICVMCAPAVIASQVHAASDAATASVDNAPGIGDGGTTGPPGHGSVIPGGMGDGKPTIEITRPSPPIHPTPMRMSEGVMEAALIYKVQPLYPAIARAIHLAGTIRLRAVIAADGSVRRVDVISGNPLLVQPAVAAVREWRYRPTRLNGEPVEVETLITVNFVLDAQ